MLRRRLHLALTATALLFCSLHCVEAQDTPLVSPPPFRPGQLWPDSDGVPINAHGAGFLFHDAVYY